MCYKKETEVGAGGSLICVLLRQYASTTVQQQGRSAGGCRGTF